MSLYLFVAILSLLFTAAAVIKARQLSVFALPWFFAGWLTSELAWAHFAWQLALTLVVALGGGLESSADRWGLVLFLLSWIGLAWCHVKSMDSGSVLEASLRDVLGENYRGDIPLTRQHVLDATVRAADWMHPFRMRRPGVRVHRNIAYGEHGHRNRLDIYQPEAPREGGFPILVQVHGGGWMIGEKQQQGQPLMYHLAARGWLCIACNYRLSPRASFPDHIIDVKRCLAWVRENTTEYGGNPAFIAITGGSAGGHLSSLAALTPDLADWQPGFEDVDTRVQAAVPFYGVYDFLDRDQLRGNMSMEGMLAKYVMKTSARADREGWERASPLSHPREDAPPFLIVHGTHDSLVWVEEARNFANRLRNQSEQVVAYAELPAAQHAFEVFHSVRTDFTLNAVTAFLEWCHARWLLDQITEED